MKKILFLVLILTSCLQPKEKEVKQINFTNLIVENCSKEDSIKVYVTLQSPNSVIGLFGIQANDTIGSCSKGYFYALKDSLYYSNDTNQLFGVVISFKGDNLPCQVAITEGFPTGINIFECSINTEYEVFDISCEDGVNSIIQTSVSDTINWSTGDGDYIKTYKSEQNTFPIKDNIDIRGVFPYRCTDCKDTGSAVPQNCFSLPTVCNKNRICQVARTGHKGGNIKVQYISAAWQICD